MHGQWEWESHKFAVFPEGIQYQDSRLLGRVAVSLGEYFLTFPRIIAPLSSGSSSPSSSYPEGKKNCDGFKGREQLA
jgi:hypothetical protein